MKYERVGGDRAGGEKSESALGGPFGSFSLLICLSCASRSAKFHKEATITAAIVSSRRTRCRTYFIFIKTRHNFTECNRVLPDVTFDVSFGPATKLISRERANSFALEEEIRCSPPLIARSFARVHARSIDASTSRCFLFPLQPPSSALIFNGL